MVCCSFEIKLELIKIAGLDKVDTERLFFCNYFIREQEGVFK